MYTSASELDTCRCIVCVGVSRYEYWLPSAISLSIGHGTMAEYIVD